MRPSDHPARSAAGNRSDGHGLRQERVQQGSLAAPESGVQERQLGDPDPHRRRVVDGGEVEQGGAVAAEDELGSDDLPVELGRGASVHEAKPAYDSGCSQGCGRSTSARPAEAAAARTASRWSA